MKYKRPRGLTLVEILIAIVVFAVGALALAASSASLAREVAWNTDRFRAASLVTGRVEAISASRCQRGSGTERSGTVTNNWVATVKAASVTIDQTITRVDSRGSHVDVVHAAAPCR